MKMKFRQLIILAVAVYQSGKVVATGYKNGKRILTETIETTQPASKLMLKTDRQTIAADGRDVAIVTIEVQDSKGRIVPDACPILTFRIEGEGRIFGVGNGDPSYLGADHPKDKDCREFSIPAFNGLAQVIIQSTKTAGSLQLTAISDGLKESILTLKAQ